MTFQRGFLDKWKFSFSMFINLFSEATKSILISVNIQDKVVQRDNDEKTYMHK